MALYTCMEIRVSLINLLSLTYRQNINYDLRPSSLGNLLDANQLLSHPILCRQYTCWYISQFLQFSGTHHPVIPQNISSIHTHYCDSTKLKLSKQDRSFLAPQEIHHLKSGSTSYCNCIPLQGYRDFNYQVRERRI